MPRRGILMEKMATFPGEVGNQRDRGPLRLYRRVTIEVKRDLRVRVAQEFAQRLDVNAGLDLPRRVGVPQIMDARTIMRAAIDPSQLIT